MKRLDHVAITVADLERSQVWYRDVLGLERKFQDAWGEEPPWMMCAENSCVALFPLEGEARPAPPAKQSIAMRHFALAVDRESFEEFRSAFDSHGMSAQFEDHGPSHSLYVSDPDGHRVEITTYEV